MALRDVVGGLAALLGIGSASCAYTNMNAMGAISAAPYENLDCFVEGNPEGYSWRIPACVCSAGVRMTYFAGPADGDDFEILYIYETGVDSDGSLPHIRMVSHSPRELERLIIGGRELLPYDQCDAGDKAQWDLARDTFSSAWANYAPVADQMFDTCTGERLDREAERYIEEHSE